MAMVEGRTVDLKHTILEQWQINIGIHQIEDNFNLSEETAKWQMSWKQISRPEFLNREMVPQYLKFPWLKLIKVEKDLAIKI